MFILEFTNAIALPFVPLQHGRADRSELQIYLECIDDINIYRQLLPSESMESGFFQYILLKVKM